MTQQHAPQSSHSAPRLIRLLALALEVEDLS